MNDKLLNRLIWDLRLGVLAIIPILIYIGTSRDSAHSKILQATEETHLLLSNLIVSNNTNVDLKIVEWHLFIDALIQKESNANTNAVGAKNDVGVLQITPIYVEEANRILGEKRYYLQDRYDKYKSIEMFNIINGKYNPEKCFKKAMALHNPLAPKSYSRDILNIYTTLLTEYKNNL